MKTLKITKQSIGLLILAAIGISLSGCAAKKAAWGSLEKGIIMKYGYQADKVLQYQNTSSFTQDFEMNEQKFTVTAEGDQTLSMKPLESKNDDLEFMVTVDKMVSTINSPRGEMNANLDEVIGKSFNLTISKMGLELEFSGAEALTYEFSTGETKSISGDIQAFFPNLSQYPVIKGDSWESNDSIVENSSSGKIKMSFSYINTFDGLETYNGYECMKINMVFIGIIEGKGETQGMQMVTNGELEGTGTWYFAYKEGLFVNQELNGVGTTTTQITGAQEMTLPAKRVYTMKSELVNL